MATSPFDAAAADYDVTFSSSVLGKAMRQAVWRRLDHSFDAGDRVLELGCGTGEDAVYLARRGVQVVATDRSAAMVDVARQKVAAANLEALVDVRNTTIEELDGEGNTYDGVLSNFGALNCVADLPEVARDLAVCLRPGGLAVLCVMGPLVPWEWAWFLIRGRPREAFRRLRSSVRWRGLEVRYPAISTLRLAFEPAFELRRVGAVGALLPPSYAEPWALKHPRLVARLDRWERRLETVPPLPWLADHYLAEFERS